MAWLEYGKDLKALHDRKEAARMQRAKEFMIIGFIVLITSVSILSETLQNYNDNNSCEINNAIKHNSN